MHYLLITIQIAVSMAAIAGLLYLFLGLCVKRPIDKELFVLIAIPVILITSGFITFKKYERDFMLSVVPDALGVSEIIYSKEESWGFGPGGNEAGIRVYPLDAQIAQKIMENGIDFFDKMPPNRNQQGRRWRGSYSGWKKTPVVIDRQGDDRHRRLEEDDRYRSQMRSHGNMLDMYDYICAYGFCIDVEDPVVEQVNAIINRPGSYYAYGRIGMIIVSPEEKIVVYMYNG